MSWDNLTFFPIRYGGNNGSVIASRNDQLLMAAGVKKRCFSWFYKMGLCNSYKTALKNNYNFAKDHDETVLLWKAEHEASFFDPTIKPTEYQVILNSIFRFLNYQRHIKNIENCIFKRNDR